MSLLRIENGCRYNVYTDNYTYEYTDNDGNFFVTFTANQVPKIGDSIDTTTLQLVPLVGYIIDNDPGFQRRDYSDGTWPETFKG